jgi:nitroimidazol reductase NimA-like FMN-containing flavoprotein (pyridoxamine 5'-phosphate oxidase superfamily)
MTEPVEGLTELKRHPERGSHDRAVIDSILDEGLFCHVGFVDAGRPFVIPTIHVRVGDEVVLHGSAASRMLRVLKEGNPCSIAVTILDGLVLARSVFNHSMNYRSVVLLGTAEVIDDPARKVEAMRKFTDKVLPGRWGDARPPSDKEIRATTMLSVPIDLASAKIRSGPPSDDAEDLDLPVWAGVIPHRLRAESPTPAPDLHAGIEYPDYLAALFPED